LDRDDKSAVNRRFDDGHVAIFAAPSTPRLGGTIFKDAPLFAETLFCAGAQGIGDMRQVNSFLRSASSRIGRRFAQIFAIAAASLPAAGV
jgi:hypothetical protein